MGINKVIYNNNVLLDLTDTTAEASDVASGKYFYGKDGVKTLGTATIGGGYVTQDENGFIVLPSTGGGGSSDTWSWMGKNPTLVKDYGITKVWLKDTAYATWTPTTTQTQISASTNLESYTWDRDNYDYVVPFRFHTHFEYGSGATGTAQLSDCFEFSSPDVAGYATDLTSITNGTDSGQSAIGSGLSFGMFYKNTIGVDAYMANFAGIYVTSSPNPSVTSTTITPKSPTIYVSCSNNFFSTDNASAVNQNTSYYEYKIEIWRVDKKTSNGSNAKEAIRDMWLNGL